MDQAPGPTIAKLAPSTSGERRFTSHQYINPPAFCHTHKKKNNACLFTAHPSKSRLYGLDTPITLADIRAKLARHNC
jgi:hypothetical protein